MVITEASVVSRQSAVLPLGSLASAADTPTDDGVAIYGATTLVAVAGVTDPLDAAPAVPPTTAVSSDAAMTPATPNTPSLPLTTCQPPLSWRREWRLPMYPPFQ